MKELTLEEEVFQARLRASCLSRFKKKIKIEHCPDGFCLGSVDTFVEKQTTGWRGSGGFGNLGNRPPKGRRKG